MLKGESTLISSLPQISSSSNQKGFQLSSYPSNDLKNEASLLRVFESQADYFSRESIVENWRAKKDSKSVIIDKKSTVAMNPAMFIHFDKLLSKGAEQDETAFIKASGSICDFEEERELIYEKRDTYRESFNYKAKNQ